MSKCEKIIIRILLVLFSIMFAFCLVLLFNKDNVVRKSKFVVPHLDASAVSGEPEEVNKELTYQKILIKEDYIVYLCATPKINKNILTIYFTSSVKNNKLLKIRIFDNNDVILGESGLIKPNSYIKDIKLNRNLKDKEYISIKVMSYENETYYSGGSFKLNIFVHK